MSDRPMHPLLMGCSVEDLRAKLTVPDSELAPWWRHLLTLARRDPVWFSPYAILAAVVTGEEEDRRLARESFLRLVELKPEGDTSFEAQFHTHVACAPIGRWAVWYDWVADMGLFSAAEDRAVRETLFDMAHAFAMPQVDGRARQFDNQILSDAFCSAAVGYVLGLRRGDSAAARELFERGLACVLDVLGRLPVGGYSLEGSTYFEQVVVPLVGLCGNFVQEVTGRPVWTEGVAPACTPLTDVLETAWRIVGPTGVLPAWDAYGFTPATVTSGLAMLARLTGDQRPLVTVSACGMWYRSSLVAWETDDRLWTLVWWPQGLDGWTCEEPACPNWLEPGTAGALQCRERGARLFQYWDECGGVTSSGRLQVDPNAVTLEAWGSPILLDGYGKLSEDLVPIPPEAADHVGQRLIESCQEYVRSSWGAEMSVERALRMSLDGSVGMSNALVLDGEGWFVPAAPVAGRGEALHECGPLAVVRSDATAHYAGRYDVTRVARASVLVDGRWALVSDRVVAATPHEVTWQAFVRRDCTAQAGRVVVTTPERVRCDLVPVQDGALELADADGYPRTPDGGSVRVRHTQPAAQDVRVDVGLVCQNLIRPVQDLTDGWERSIGARTDTVSLDDAYLADPGTEPDAPRVFRRSFDLRRDPGRGYVVRLAVANPGTTLVVNGRRVAPAFEPEPVSTWRNGALMPWTFDVTDALRDGRNEIELTAPYFHGESACGPVGLWESVDPEPVDLEQVGVSAFRVRIGAEEHEVLVEREGPASEWCGGRTDARYAVRTGGDVVAAADVTELSLPGGPSVRASAPCDVAWSPYSTEITRCVEGASIEIEWPGARLLVRVGASVRITYSGQAAHLLKLWADAPRAVYVNGREDGEADRTGRLVLEPIGAPSPTPESVEGVYALVEAQGAGAADALIGALRSPHWRVQMAAAEVVGRLGLKAAVPVLLELFEEGERELPYPKLTRWWRWSKMLRDPDGIAGVDETLPMPLAAKRWRVKRAVVSALGRLGDERAVEPIETALGRCDDFFPVTSQLTVALGRLGAAGSARVLERFVHHAEANTRRNARLALALLKGEVSRAEFERQVGG